MAKKLIEEEADKLGSQLVRSIPAELLAITTQEAVRAAVYDFYTKRMSILADDEAFRLKLQNKIGRMADGEEDEKLSPNQILGVFKFIATNNNQTLKTLLEMWKPTPNATTPFTDGGGTLDDIESATNDLTPQDRDTFVMLQHAINSMNKKQG